MVTPADSKSLNEQEEIDANYRKAADGDSAALDALGKLALAGSAEAGFRLGRLYDFFNEKRKTNTYLALAREWYEKAAQLGHPFAQFALGNMYDYGEGVDQDHKQARQWYEAAARQNVHDAQMHIARMLQTGRGGHQSNSEAAHWYKMAADQGDELAMTNLALMHYGHQIENASDADAFALFSASAEKLDGLAHLMLGEMYLEGRGTVQEGGRALFHVCVAVLVLPAGKNRDSAMSRQEMILKQFPQHRSDFEKRALNYVKDRKGNLPH